MKFAIVLLAVAASSQAWVPAWNGWNGWNTWDNTGLYRTGWAGTPLAYNNWVAPAVSASQYHSQDEFGQASYGYAHPGQAANNVRDAWGNQAGSWSYVDANGKVVTNTYVADALGFRVVSNNLPEMTLTGPAPVQDTPEVQAAKDAHMRALESAARGEIPTPVALPVPVMDVPQPVQDTPEVAAAKAEHMRALAEAAARAAEQPERKKRSVILTPASTSPLAALAPLPLLRSASLLAAPAPVWAAPTPLAAPWIGAPALRVAAPLTTPIVAAPAVAVAAAPAAVTREATLTKIVHNPNHAVSYRVD